MHKQRIWLASIAAFGVLTAFLPWVTVWVVGVSAIEIAQGWVVLVLYGAALAVTFLAGSRAEPMDTPPRGIVAILGAAAAGFAVWKYVEISRGTVELGGEIGAQLEQQGGKELGEVGSSLGREMTSMFGDLFSVGLGLYASIAAGLALAIAAFAIARKR